MPKIWKLVEVSAPNKRCWMTESTQCLGSVVPLAFGNVSFKILSLIPWSFVIVQLTPWSGQLVRWSWVTLCTISSSSSPSSFSNVTCEQRDYGRYHHFILYRLWCFYFGTYPIKWSWCLFWSLVVCSFHCLTSTLRFISPSTLSIDIFCFVFVFLSPQ